MLRSISVLCTLVFAAQLTSQTPPKTQISGEAITNAAVSPLTTIQGDAILEELKQIRVLLQRQTSAATISPTLVGDIVNMPVRPGWHSLGSQNAPVTVVEFTDYQCPFCRSFEDDSFKKLKRDFIDTGKVRFVLRDLPLDFHSNAMQAASAVRCAGDQGLFWEMHDALMHNKSNDLSRAAILSFAGATKLQLSEFSNCLDTNEVKKALNTDIADAGSFGISGTPSFIIGRTDAKNISGVRIEGAVPYSVFESTIQKHLSPD